MRAINLLEKPTAAPAEPPPPRMLAPLSIEGAVAEALEFHGADASVFADRRRGKFAEARRDVWRRLRDLRGMTPPAIAAATGSKRTTVIEALR